MGEAVLPSNLYNIPPVLRKELVYDVSLIPVAALIWLYTKSRESSRIKCKLLFIGLYVQCIFAFKLGYSILNQQKPLSLVIFAISEYLRLKGHFIFNSLYLFLGISILKYPS